MYPVLIAVYCTHIVYVQLCIIRVTDKIIVINTNLVLLRLGLSEVAQSLHNGQGRPYTDTPFVIPPGILKSSQPIGNDPNLCMAYGIEFNIYI